MTDRRNKRELEAVFKALFDRPPEVGIHETKFVDFGLEFEISVRVTKHVPREELAALTESVYAHLTTLHYWPLSRCEEGRLSCHNPVTRAVVFHGFLTNKRMFRFTCAIHAHQLQTNRQIEAVIELVDKLRLQQLKKSVLARQAKSAKVSQ